MTNFFVSVRLTWAPPVSRVAVRENGSADERAHCQYSKADNQWINNTTKKMSNDLEFLKIYLTCNIKFASYWREWMSGAPKPLQHLQCNWTTINFVPDKYFILKRVSLRNCKGQVKAKNWPTDWLTEWLNEETKERTNEWLILLISLGVATPSLPPSPQRRKTSFLLHGLGYHFLCIYQLSPVIIRVEVNKAD